MTDIAELGAVERRIAIAGGLVGDDADALARIVAAPAGYLLSHGSSDVARHAALLSPAPSAGEVRVVATPGPAAGTWHLDVAATDRPGLLAACTGVLAEHRIEVVQAVVATWEDGAALEAFVVRAAVPPEPGRLRRALEAALDRPLAAPPLPGADVRFDHEASTAFTACEVRAPDQPGLLHALAVAIAAAGADVHAARATTLDGVAVDRFDLSDTTGRKLDARLEAAVRAHVRDGFSPGAASGRRPWFRRRGRSV